MIIALASPRIASTLDGGLDQIRRLLSEASAQGAEIVCFPEAYLPGLRGQDFDALPFDQAQEERVLQAVAGWARTYAVATISTGSSVAWPFATRAGGTPRRYAGRLCGGPKSSFTPTTRGVTGKVLA